MSKSALQKQRLLLIERNDNHAELIENALKPHFLNLSIDIASTYLAGVEKARARRYDLILTDFFLPHITGIETIEKIRRVSRDVPIVVITGRGDDRTASLALRAGATDYIVKSKETLNELPETVARALGERRSRRSSSKIAGGWSPSNIAARIMSEVNHMTLKVRDLGNLVKGGTKQLQKPAPAADKDINTLLNQIKRLKELASKLVR